MKRNTHAFELQARWQLRFEADSLGLATDRDYYEMAREMMGLGMPLQALEVTEEGCQRWPENLILAQMRGMALARSHSTQAAAEQLSIVVDRLRRLEHADRYLLEESIGTLARTEKDFALQANSMELRHRHLEKSCVLYEEAYRSMGGYWTGINVATLLTLLGRTDEARAIATNLQSQCHGLLAGTSHPASESYWILATLGEAALNLQDFPAAADYYQQAAVLADRRYGDIRSSQRHVELLLDHFQQDSSLSRKWLPLPAVAVFTGHLIDAPDRPIPRFPTAYEAQVREAIRRWIGANDVAIGYSSAACGSDILFHEVLQECGGESYIVLPFAEEAFIKTSVDNGSAGWIDRFWKVIAGASGVIRTARDQTDQGPIAYSYANRVIAGTAWIKSSELGSDLVGLAVWDGEIGQSGGTADAIQAWRGLGIHMTQVQLPTKKPDCKDAFELAPVQWIADPVSFSPAGSENGDTQLMTLLFADAVGFSQLSDREVRLFLKEYLGRVAELLDKYGDKIAVRETAGDGLYLAFTSLAAAGSCALDLSALVEQTPWLEMGFNTALRLRIALHAGPVILGHDPVTGLPKGVGAHVSRAARLEPKTPPGQVYASEAFAALAHLECELPFRCRYVKQLEWAKRYGTFPTYLVSR